MHLSGSTLQQQHPAAAVGMELPDSLMPFCQAPQQFLLDLVQARGPAARFRMNDEQFLVLGDPAWAHAVLNGTHSPEDEPLAEAEPGPVAIQPAH